MRVIKKERKEAIAEFGCVFDFGTMNVSELTNDQNLTNAEWYGYSSYENYHIDFMLFNMGA